MDDRLTEVRKKVFRTGLTENMRFLFIELINHADLSDKKIRFFMKIDDPRIIVGFLFRLLISSAYKYNVPEIYIKECIESKKSYGKHKSTKRKRTIGDYWYESNDNGDMYKQRMKSDFTKLLKATVQMAKIKNSRKEKISKVLEKIAIKNN